MSTELNARQDTVEGMPENGMKDLKGVGHHVGELLKEVAHFTAEEFTAARPKIEGKLAEAKSTLEDARLAVTRKATGAADATHVYMRENLWTALGVAVATGLVIGFLISRR